MPECSTVSLCFTWQENLAVQYTIKMSSLPKISRRKLVKSLRFIINLTSEKHFRSVLKKPILRRNGRCDRKIMNSTCLVNSPPLEYFINIIYIHFRQHFKITLSLTHTNHFHKLHRTLPNSKKMCWIIWELSSLV